MAGANPGSFLIARSRGRTRSGEPAHPNERSALRRGLRSRGTDELCLQFEPNPKHLEGGDTSLDAISPAYSSIVDAKSPFTYNHSPGVANAAIATARVLGLSRERIAFLQQAALLHDLGKLGVSNAILEKPAQLNNDEWALMKAHPRNTWNILRAIPGFETLSEVAGSHHEKLDGTGCFRGASAELLPLESRILAVADIFEALAANCPYREGLPRERVFQILTGRKIHMCSTVPAWRRSNNPAANPIGLFLTLRRYRGN